MVRELYLHVKNLGDNFVGKNNIEEDFSNFGFDANVSISNHMSEVLSELPTLVGAPLGRILIIKGKQVCLIGKEDYHWSMKRFIGVPHAILSPLDGYIYPEGLAFNTVNGDVPDIQDPVMMLKIVQIKWRLGYYSYSSAEEKVLTDWLKTLTKVQIDAHWKWLNQRSNIEQIKLFQKIVV